MSLLQSHFSLGDENVQELNTTTNSSFVPHQVTARSIATPTFKINQSSLQFSNVSEPVISSHTIDYPNHGNVPPPKRYNPNFQRSNVVVGDDKLADGPAISSHHLEFPPLPLIAPSEPPRDLKRSHVQFGETTGPVVPYITTQQENFRAVPVVHNPPTRSHNDSQRSTFVYNPVPTEYFSSATEAYQPPKPAQLRYETLSPNRIAGNASHFEMGREQAPFTTTSHASYVRPPPTATSPRQSPTRFPDAQRSNHVLGDVERVKEMTTTHRELYTGRQPTEPLMNVRGNTRALQQTHFDLGTGESPGDWTTTQHTQFKDLSKVVSPRANNISVNLQASHVQLGDRAKFREVTTTTRAEFQAYQGTRPPSQSQVHQAIRQSHFDIAQDASHSSFVSTSSSTYQNHGVISPARHSMNSMQSTIALGDKHGMLGNEYISTVQATMQAPPKDFRAAAPVRDRHELRATHFQLGGTKNDPADLLSTTQVHYQKPPIVK